MRITVNRIFSGLVPMALIRIFAYDRVGVAGSNHARGRGGHDGDGWQAEHQPRNFVSPPRGLGGSEQRWTRRGSFGRHVHSLVSQEE